MTFGDLFEDSGVDGPVPSSASPGFTNLITLVAGYAVQIRQRQRAWPHQCETEKTEPELRLACIPIGLRYQFYHYRFYQLGPDNDLSVWAAQSLALPHSGSPT